ncbi:hypothetical protein SASPL_135679 [Salvia splendens]|uniref:Protein FAR1-RELATED SEQUENCE n=1 Tax=Salvia splendens TaxID=180675 RepID=A0A8X8ZFZ8_SALSN|nr:hypothetical protein SASPL_135679 [Salvia splendens]
MDSETPSTSHVDNQSPVDDIVENTYYNTTAKMKTEWSIEKHASTIFTDGAFKEIQEQIMEAYNHCSLVSISNDSSPEVYKEVDVQPPEVVSTKGCGSRLSSRVEKDLKLKNKPMRQCKKCQEWGHHDSRNCDKFKEKKKMWSRRNSDV